MRIVPGNGLLLSIPFADSGTCSNRRVFIVIETCNSLNSLKVLNISSIAGKAHKLLFASNEIINNHNPPFREPSFVKLDALYELEYFQELNLSILNHGNILDPNELNRILTKFNGYSLTSSVNRVFYNSRQVKHYNSNLI
jgi:hypothetical protein